MRKLIILSLLFLSITITAQDIGADYYVATTGSDSNPGTYAEPWATFVKASEGRVPGDTVVFMAGVYNFSDRVRLWSDDSGEAGNRIVYMGYPGETIIFDMSGYNPPASTPGDSTSTSYPSALRIDGAGYLTFKNFTIRNVLQHRRYAYVTAIDITFGHNIIVENVTVHNCGGRGIFLNAITGMTQAIRESYGIYTDTDTTMFINCDVYNCADSLPAVWHANGIYQPGNSGDGIKSYAYDTPGVGSIISYVVFRGCRSWHNSDDGFDCGNNTKILMDNCWSYHNGELDYGNGEGFKMSGGFIDESLYMSKVYRNCIAAGNRSIGFFLLEYPNYLRTNAGIYNNLSYNNRYGFAVSNNYVYPTPIAQWRNNIGYKSTELVYNKPLDWISSYVNITESNNTWACDGGYPGSVPNPDIVLTDADFVSLDATQLIRARKADGSLPDITFGRLANDSDLHGAGTDVGMSDVPDIGIDWAYLDGESDPPIPVTGITVSGAGSATTITTDNGTLQLSAAILPIDADLQTVTWSIADGTGHAHISVGGLVLAITDGTVTARATANDGSDVYDELELTLSNQTNPTLATVSTSLPVARNVIKSVGGGNASADGGATITDRGICWNTSLNPTTSNDHIHATGTTGAYTLIMAELLRNTTYYVRSFATNSEGTSYGANESFTTPVQSTIGTGTVVYTDGGHTLKIK